MKNIFLFLMLLVAGFATVSIVGCEKGITKPVVDGMKPTMDDPEAYTVATVEMAIERYKTEGRDATLAYYNDPMSINGQWYVFIVDDTDIFVAHPALPTLVGTDLKNVVGADGYPIGIEIAKATEDGHWINYLWHNPAANKLETKRTWALRYDGYIFGSGHYEPWNPDPATLPEVSKDDPEAFTVDFVYKAIARYEFEGLEAAVAYYNDPASIDGQWYASITSPNDIFLAHAPRPDLVGTDIKDVKGLDGSPLGEELVTATGSGAWFEYEWANPESGEVELKRAWAIRHDGYLFGAGYYTLVP